MTIVPANSSVNRYSQKDLFLRKESCKFSFHKFYFSNYLPVNIFDRMSWQNKLVKYADNLLHLRRSGRRIEIFYTASMNAMDITGKYRCIGV